MKTTILAALIAGAMLAAVPAAQAASDEITVISREDGSGTRGAFVELFKIEEKNASGKKIDRTIDSADITNSTSVMLTSVASNANAIGYVSLGSLNAAVKALHINGAEASVAAIKAGRYPISRPFNIATKAELSPAARDFISFILSREGQAVVEARGYISALQNPAPFKGGHTAGRLVIGGSSSVTPVMEKLKEAYAKLNPEVDIQIQQSDSTTGMASAISGIADIGMASRELKASELGKGLTPRTIAIDGIAVIVSTKNAVDNLSAEQVKDIYTGKTTRWSEVR